VYAHFFYIYLILHSYYSPTPYIPNHQFTVIFAQIFQSIPEQRFETPALPVSLTSQIFPGWVWAYIFNYVLVQIHLICTPSSYFYFFQSPYPVYVMGFNFLTLYSCRFLAHHYVRIASDDWRKMVSLKYRESVQQKCHQKSFL